jgi:hypothetical protein
MARLLKAGLIILVIPAILYLVTQFQDYTSNNMTLNTYEQIFIDALPFIIIGLFLWGVFKAIGAFNNRGGE